jgi:hypothetical protein
MVHIMDKQIESMNPLFQSPFYNLPILMVNDSGNNIKGQDLFGAFFAALDGKGVSQLKQRGLSGPLSVHQVLFRQGLYFVDQQFRAGPGSSAFIEKFVIKSLGLVVGKFHGNSSPG